MNGVLSHLCTHIGIKSVRGKPPEDGEMIEMTLSSRHIHYVASSIDE